MNVIKSYTRRDSATALLRKMGLDKSEYSLFVTIGDNGNFNVDVTAVEKYLARAEQDTQVQVADPKVADPKVSEVADPKVSEVADPKVADPKVADPKVSEVATVSEVARSMILAGKSNKEVWDVIKVQFNLEDSKKTYPSWYRCELKRKGLL